MAVLAGTAGVAMAIGVDVGNGVGEGKGVGVGNTVGEGKGVGVGKAPVGVGLTDAVGEGFTVTIRRGEIWHPTRNVPASSAVPHCRTRWIGFLS